MKWRRVFAGSAVLLCACSVQAQEIMLKVHHPLPSTSTAHQKVLEPWCAKITAESKGRIKCQIYPSMQLGGSVPQLYDQVKDGVVDVIWTVAGYSAGKLPSGGSLRAAVFHAQRRSLQQGAVGLRATA